jgi:hypothetical protein
MIQSDPNEEDGARGFRKKFLTISSSSEDKKDTAAGTACPTHQQPLVALQNHERHEDSGITCDHRLYGSS